MSAAIAEREVQELAHEMRPWRRAQPAATFDAMAAAPSTPAHDGALPGVTLYGEADLQPLEAANAEAMPHLVRDLVSARSARQRERVVRDRLDEIGFEWMGYYTVRTQPGGGVDRAYLVTYSQVEWVKNYFDERYDEVDPCHAQSPTSALPHLWDIASVDDTIKARTPSTRSRKFLDDLHDSGLCSGLSFQVPARDGNPAERTVVSFASSVASRRWMGDRVVADSLLFGLSFHDYMSQYTTRPCKAAGEAWTCGTNSDALSPLPKAVLACVLRGLTDRQIADQLRVSAHAVDYHLRKLRQRFAARNRVQLVNAATRAAEAL